MARKSQQRARPSVARPTRKPAGSSARKRASTKPRTHKPIDLYYWPTPNGYKISIMLE